MNIKTSLLLLSLSFSTGWSATVFAETTTVQSTRQQTVSFSIQNMTCAMCTLTIKKALQKVDGVEQATVDYASKTATVTFDSSKTDTAALIKATTDAGYPATVKPVSQ